MSSIKVEELARQVVADVNTDANYLMCIPWINDVYKEFVRKAHPSHLIDTGELNLLPYVTGGVVTTDRGSKIVTADADALAAWIAGGGNSIVGMHFRINAAWYEIVGIDLVTGYLTLKSGFGEDSNTSNNYSIIKRFYSLPDDVRWISSLVQPGRPFPIEKVDREMLDRLYADRSIVSSFVDFWCDQGVDPETGGRRIEIYPPVKDYKMLIYAYSKLPQKLEADDYLPQFIDSDALKEGVKVYAFEYKAAKFADAGKVDLATFYLNWAGRQRTVWKGKLSSAILAESHGNVKNVILQTLKTKYGYTGGWESLVPSNNLIDEFGSYAVDESGQMIRG